VFLSVNVVQQSAV